MVWFVRPVAPHHVRTGDRGAAGWPVAAPLARGGHSCGEAGGFGCRCGAYGRDALLLRCALCGDVGRVRVAPRLPCMRLGDRITPTAAEKRGLLELSSPRLGDSFRRRTGELYEPGGVCMWSSGADAQGGLLTEPGLQLGEAL